MIFLKILSARGEVVDWVDNKIKTCSNESAQKVIGEDDRSREKSEAAIDKIGKVVRRDEAK